MKIQHDIKDKIFFVEDNGTVAEMTYRIKDNNIMVINHTWVEPIYRDAGLARQLVDAGVEYARANNFKIIPLCGYVAALFNKNQTEFDDVWKR